jgi:hypothetical protein
MLCLLVLGNDPSRVPAARAEVVAQQSTDDVEQLKLWPQKRLESAARGLRTELAIKRRLPATPANDAAIVLLTRRLIEIECEIATRRIHGR